MIAKSSQTSLTTARSWVTYTSDMSRSVRILRRSRRMRCCTVTSSAVVGSSQSRTRGSEARAMAIMTRWRCPPEIWCGYLRMAAGGSGMSTSRRSERARSFASRPGRPPARSTSPSSCSTLSRGLSAPSGSWKIIAAPGVARGRRLVDRGMASPFTLISPERTVTIGGSRPMSARRVSDLPEPDSPTMPSAAPGRHRQVEILHRRERTAAVVYFDGQLPSLERRDHHTPR